MSAGAWSSREGVGRREGERKGMKEGGSGKEGTNERGR